MKALTISIRGLLAAALLLCLTAFTVNSVYAGDFDSLTAYQKMVRAAAVYNTNSLSASDLTYLTNMAAKIVQTQIKSKVSVDRFAMSAYTLQYALNDDVMGGQVMAVIWKTADGKKETSLAPIPADMIGKVLDNPGPHYYFIAGRTLIVHNQAVSGDSLLVYYAPYANRMTADADSAGIDVTDDVAVALLTASFVSASRERTALMNFWYGVYVAYKNSRTGEVSATKD